MSKLLQINDFALSGLNSDIMPWDLPAGYLTNIKNIRIVANKLKPHPGYSYWIDMPDFFVPGFIMNVNAVDAEFWLIACTDGMFAFDGVDFADARILGGYPGITDPTLWNGCMLSQIPILNHPQDFPQYWSPQAQGTLMVHLPWDDTQDWKAANQKCKIMRSHKQFLFALNLVDEGLVITDGVRWSSPADAGDLPLTWDEQDTTDVAGQTRLSGDGGQIIDGLSLRDAFVVYRETAITVFDYVGGPYVWQIRNMSTTYGLININSLVEVNGKHYFIGQTGIFVNDGNAIEPLLHNRLKKRFVSDFNSENADNCFVVRNDVVDEIWFFIPTYKDSEYPEIVYIYNWRDDTWTIIETPYLGIRHAAYGTEAEPSEAWDDLPDSTEWINVQGIWNTGSGALVDRTMVGIQAPAETGNLAGRLVFLDRPGDEVFYFQDIERLGFPLEGLDKVTTITRVYPHAEGPGTFFVQIGSQDFPGAATKWKDPVEFNPKLDRKIDIRTTGELHCFKFYSFSSQGDWTLSGLDVEYTPAGLR